MIFKYSKDNIMNIV